MSKLTLITLIICGICILGIGFGYIVYAGSIDCQSHAELFAANDYGPSVLAETSYKPCKGDLYWTFVFNRTSWPRPEHECTIEYRITKGVADVVWFSDAHSWLYDTDTQDNSQEAWCSIWMKLINITSKSYGWRVSPVYLKI